MADASFNIESEKSHCKIKLSGDWQLGKTPTGETICHAISSDSNDIQISTDGLGVWDSSLVIVLLSLVRWCNEKKILLDTSSTPQSLQNLLHLATEIPTSNTQKSTTPKTAWQWSRHAMQSLGQEVSTTFIFIGDTFLAFKKLFSGKANTRKNDILFFIAQAGPQGLPIITLISIAVGMILAYLGAVQLRQLGAQVYVANLVSLGMVREMGPLITAIIIAGRTGAAYAAQLGTMQANEEIDALKTMGVSSMEFLVTPRLIALIFIMPLICIYANVLGLVGGALVASGMDVSFKQYILQTQSAVEWGDIFSGLFKSLVFGILIAIAGCQAGLHSGRSSIAVGTATTHAVVKAIVYLVLSDAAINVLYDKLGI